MILDISLLNLNLLFQFIQTIAEMSNNTKYCFHNQEVVSFHIPAGENPSMTEIYVKASFKLEERNTTHPNMTQSKVKIR